MRKARVSNRDRRVVVLAPTSRDATLTTAIFERDAIPCTVCADVSAVVAELRQGCAALILPEEAVADVPGDELSSWVADQPPWSDLAIIVLARPGADSAAVARAMDLLGNVTVVERPMRVSALVSAARSALRARMRQYQIRDHIADRERTAQTLRDNDRRKDEFLAILAHELRNPLAPLRSALHVLRLGHGEDEDVRQVAGVMERQVDQLVRLVDDLLEVSRITRGKIQLSRERIDVREALTTAIEAARPLIESARHRLDVAIEERPLPVDADPMRLAQVFGNLLNNAIKYTDPGGHVAIEARREGETAVIRVRDDGIGIPPQMLARVFELFAQADHGSTRAQGGLGIGLTLVQRLVQMHGGEVVAESPGVGRGSTFTVKLPLVAAAAGPHVPRAATDRQALRACQLLLADDNRDAADTLGALLRALGAEVKVVYDGAAALDALAAYRPEAVLLDIGMPGLDGYEVARRIRGMPELDRVTLIALTGWGQRDDRRRSRDAGFDHHLTKPADAGMLAALLQR